MSHPAAHLENGSIATVPSQSYGWDGNKPVRMPAVPIPYHNQQVIDESNPADVVITYKLDGSTVATKHIVTNGTTTTSTVS